MKLRAISFLLAVLLGGWQTATAAQKTLRGSAHAFSGDTVIVRGAKLRLFGIVCTGVEMQAVSPPPATGPVVNRPSRRWRT
ncbi:MAG: hypothetical protein R3F53_07890 [Gammaproteobacteria bacterium]